MLVADVSGFIHNEQGRDASHLEEIPFLAVQIGHPVPGVGQANVGQVVFAPVAAVGIGAVGANGEDFRVTRGKGRVIIAQASEMGAAVGSHKSAQKDQDEILFALEIRQLNKIAVNVGQFKVGGGRRVFHGWFSGFPV